MIRAPRQLATDGNLILWWPVACILNHTVQANFFINIFIQGNMHLDGLFFSISLFKHHTRGINSSTQSTYSRNTGSIMTYYYIFQ